MTSFTAQVKNWSEKAKRNATLVVKQSAEDVFEVAQRSKAKGGRMPVLNSDLKNSLIAGLNGSTSLKGPDSYILAIAGMDAGDVMFGGWTADHGPAREYGHNGIPPDFFMRGAAQEWQAIVAANAAKLKD